MLVSEASTVAAKPMNGTNALQRLDCVAGVRGLELGNVVANYPFEKSRRFTEILPNFGHETIRV
jgi:hypothetical protein